MMDILSGMMIGMVVLVVIIIAMYCYLEHKYRVEDDYSQIDSIYKSIWTGHDYDRVHAWYRVIAHLEAFNPDAELIRKAQESLEVEKKSRLSDTYINVNGKPVLHRGFV